jgi:hypothetical protein
MLTRYAFSFTVAERPDYVQAFPSTVVAGSGQGSFSIRHRQIDRDGTVFWDLTNLRGTLSLSIGGRVIVSARVVGGYFGTEGATSGLQRVVKLQLRITRSTRFHCSTPMATLGLQDLPQTQGNLDGMQFHACGADLQWSGRTPRLTVNVAPS